MLSENGVYAGMQYRLHSKIDSLNMAHAFPQSKLDKTTEDKS